MATPLLSVPERPLFEFWPALAEPVGFSALGEFPTPVEPLLRLVPSLGAAARDAHVKRDDLSSPLYGGNKVRTLEPLLGRALREGKSWVAATGAYGSNHAVASVIHAARLGLRCAVLLFPQPVSETAQANLRVSLASAGRVISLAHWSCLPAAMWWFEREQRRRGEPALIMPPGGAIPRGGLGLFSAGLELGLQVQAGVLPAPQEVVLALGSTCSSAGLLVGLLVATRLGLGFGGPRGSRPLLVAVRVTPWPVTSAFRILRLAGKLARWLRTLTGDRVFDIERAELAGGLEIDGGQLGAGYGRPTAAGLAALQRAGAFAPALDTTYAAKSAAALFERLTLRPNCVRLFWSTKSSLPLPEVSPRELEDAPPRMLRWLAQPVH